MTRKIEEMTNDKKNWGNQDSVNGIWREIFSFKLCSWGRKHFIHPSLVFAFNSFVITIRQLPYNLLTECTLVTIGYWFKPWLILLFWIMMRLNTLYCDHFNQWFGTKKAWTSWLDNGQNLTCSLSANVCLITLHAEPNLLAFFLVVRKKWRKKMAAKWGKKKKKVGQKHHKKEFLHFTLLIFYKEKNKKRKCILHSIFAKCLWDRLFFFFFLNLCRTLIMALTAVHKSTRVHHQV